MCRNAGLLNEQLGPTEAGLNLFESNDNRFILSTPSSTMRIHTMYLLVLAQVAVILAVPLPIGKFTLRD
jgi:hypothetical protein